MIVKEWPDSRLITTHAEMLDMLLAHRTWLIDKNAFSRTAKWKKWTRDDIAEAYAEVWIKLATLGVFKENTCSYWRNYFFRCFNSYYMEIAAPGKRHHSSVSKLPWSDQEVSDQPEPLVDERIEYLRERLIQFCEPEEADLILWSTVREACKRTEVPAISSSDRALIKDFLIQLDSLADAAIQLEIDLILDKIQSAYKLN